MEVQLYDSMNGPQNFRISLRKHKKKLEWLWNEISGVEAWKMVGLGNNTWINAVELSEDMKRKDRPWQRTP